MLRPQGYLKPARRRTFWNSSTVILVVNGVISLLLIGLVIGCPPASRWISEAVQAEFAGTVLPDSGSTKIAQPAQQTQTARNN
jgi:hypothetical protein